MGWLLCQQVKHRTPESCSNTAGDPLPKGTPTSGCLSTYVHELSDCTYAHTLLKRKRKKKLDPVSESVNPNNMWWKRHAGGLRRRKREKRQPHSICNSRKSAGKEEMYAAFSHKVSLSGLSDGIVTVAEILLGSTPNGESIFFCSTKQMCVMIRKCWRLSSNLWYKCINYVFVTMEKPVVLSCCLEISSGSSEKKIRPQSTNKRENVERLREGRL